MAYRPLTNLNATYNIFLTTKREIAEEFVTYKNNPNKTFSIYTKEKYLPLTGGAGFVNSVVLNTADSNVLELSHSFNFGEGDNGNRIHLKTFEPGLDILKKLFFLFLSDQVTEIKFRKNSLETRANRVQYLKDRVDHALRQITDWSVYDSLDPETGAGRGDGFDMFTDAEYGNPTFLKMLKIIEGQEAAVKEEMLQIHKSAVGRIVYISYGVGDDFKQWAGPFQTILGSLDYENDGIEETITYNFATDHIERQFDVAATSENPDFGAVNFIRPTIPIAAWDYYPFAEQTKEMPSKLIKGVAVPIPGFTPSLHDIIVKLISYYLYNLGIKNHLIVLPNLDQLLAGQVAQTIGVTDWHRLFETYYQPPTGNFPDIFSEAIAEKGGSMQHNVGNWATSMKAATLPEQIAAGGYGAFNSALQQDWYDIATLDPVLVQIRQLYGNLFSWADANKLKTKISVGTKGIGGGTSTTTEEIPLEPGPTVYAGGLEKIDRLMLGERVQILLDIFARLGLRADKSEGESSDSDPNFVKYARGDFSKTLGTAEKGTEGDQELTKILQGGGWKSGTMDVAESDKLNISNPFTGEETYNAADAILFAELPFQHLFEKGAPGFGAYIKPIMDIVNALLLSSGQTVFSLSAFWENNVNVVKLFREKFGSGTFEGYSQATQTPDSAYLAYGAGAYEGQTPPTAYEDNYFIFGDQTLIKSFLYGDYRNLVDFNMDARRRGFLVSHGVPTEYNKQAGVNNSSYFLDPFWNRLRIDLTTANMNSQDRSEISRAKAGEEEITLSPDYVADLLEQEETYLQNVNESYFGKINDLVQGGIKGGAHMGHFNEYDLNTSNDFEFVRYLPDEFHFLLDVSDPEKEKNLKAIQRVNPAIFIGNDEQGNVLSYSFNSNHWMFTQFFGTLKDIYYNTSTRYSEVVAPYVAGQAGDIALTQKTFGALDKLSTLGGWYGHSFSQIFQDVELPTDKGKLATDLVDIMLMESTGLTRYNPEGRRSSVISMVMLFMSLFKYQYRGTLKVLPMFGISSMSFMQRPAIVLLKSAGRVKLNMESMRSTSDFFSGLYRILGFRHTISTNNVGSEFIVYKDIEGLLSNETAEE